MEPLKPMHRVMAPGVGAVQGVAGPLPPSPIRIVPSCPMVTERGLCRPLATTTGVGVSLVLVAAWLGTAVATRLPNTAAARKAPAQDLLALAMSLLNLARPPSRANPCATLNVGMIGIASGATSEIPHLHGIQLAFQQMARTVVRFGCDGRIVRPAGPVPGSTTCPPIRG